MKDILIALDNLKSANAEEAMKEAQKLGIEIVFPPAIFPQPESDRIHLEEQRYGHLYAIHKAY